ncbi:hypothetical protein R3P38DRAFT_2787492 [Favolaschia claudopus]|uniref:Uncharacterized protein n=1 Tax=Favolaschia claudopus TaxID=2862362 RepID=A0AAW0AN71_9AGAR
MDSADEYDEYFEFGHFTPEAEQEIARIEREALGACSPSTRAFTNCVDISEGRIQEIPCACLLLQTRNLRIRGDNEDMDSENEDDESEPRGARNKEKVVDGGKASFTQPKGMPAWLYTFFRKTIQCQPPPFRHAFRERLSHCFS